MASSTQTKITIPKADFTTSGGVVNNQIFLQELIEAALSVEPIDVSQVASDVVVTLGGLGTSADIAAIDAAAANHTGSAFASSSQRETNNAVVSAVDGTEVQTVLLDTGPLPSGPYDLESYVEHRASDSGGESTVSVKAGKNGSARVEVGSHSSPHQNYQSVSVPFSTNLVDGDSVQIEIVVARPTGPGTADARRSRIFFKRDNE